MAASDAIDQAKSKLEPLLAPIDGGVGADITYDEAFEKIKNEVEKLQSLQGGKVDWPVVASNSEELLTEKTKDFRLALYFAAAKVFVSGLDGLLDGLVLIQELTAAFWDSMYPSLKRPKQRGNLCGWYSDIAVTKFATYQPTAADRDRVNAIDEVSKTVDGFLRDKLEDAYPTMNALRNLVRNLVLSLPAEQVAAPPPPPVAAAAPVAAVAAAAAAAPPPPPPPVAAPGAGGMGDTESALRVASECGAAIIKVGSYLRTEDPSNAIAYRVTRIGMWLDLYNAPDTRNGKTFARAPPDSFRAEWEELLAADNYVGMINSAEEAASVYSLWLDPHRYVIRAMDRAGDAFANARTAIVNELSSLLRRVPTLPSMFFSNGTPLADGQTKSWIDGEVAASGAGGGGGQKSELDEPLNEAMSLVMGGKLPDAITLLTKAIGTVASPADRFRGRLAMAKLCLQSEQFIIAKAQLEGLQGLVDVHRLEAWEPALCAELYSALYAAHRGMNSRGYDANPDARLREAAAFDRLCQLDAAAALKLSTG